MGVIQNLYTKSKKREQIILRSVLIFGLISLPFSFHKPPIKDWLIVFFTKATLSSFVASYLTTEGGIKFPVRYKPDRFGISIVFDYLLFPLLCVWYNQLTYKSKWFLTICKAFCFSIPMTLIEILLERKTQTVEYKKGWSWLTTFISLTVTFWLVRGFMSLIRFIDQRSILNVERNP
ncbi:CBO0543 family protein [Halalkalibacter okhensis]|uniref:CBO0543 family protein n=1 Tax=Halalkalibacter okhensis TaxID=333138 RepID=UPI00068FFE07|nr:CBO0543 family protein [Halalkalibacter okhensis]